MSLITDKFEAIANDRNIQFKSEVHSRPLKTRDGKEVEQKQKVFQTSLKVGDNTVVPSSVVIHDSGLDRVNYQITYNKIAQVTDRHKLPQILEKLNELNSMKSGYYHFIVTPDGELVLRHLGITGEDVRPLLNTFVYGGRILNLLTPELKEIDGLKLTGVKAKQN